MSQLNLRSFVSVAIVAACLLALPLMLAGCSGSEKDDGTSIVVSGSTTVLPIAEQSAEEFTKEHPQDSILVSGMGSSAGIEAVSVGTAQIGTSSRDLKDNEKDLGLTDIPIAHDGIAVVVNENNPVKSLTTDQLRDIFSGKITNWKEVGGPNLEIERVNRDEASGTREAFFKIVMQKQKFDEDSVVLPGTGQVRQVVSRTKGAIGYISVGFVNEEVKAVTIDGIAPTKENVARGTYPISRELHFFVKEKPQGLTKEYIDYVLSDKVQQGPVVDAGFVPVGHAKEGK